MTGEWILLIIGAVLLLAGAVGARVVRRAGSRATPPATARAAAAGVGVLCVAAALMLPSTGTSSAAVKAVVENELAAGQISERIRVFIDGKAAGTLSVDRRSPKARLTVTVSRPGEHSYRLESSRRLEGKAPSIRTSRGEVVIDGSGPLVLYADDAGRVYLG